MTCARCRACERAAYVSFMPMTMRGGIWEVLTTTPDPTSLGGFAAPTRRASCQPAIRHAGLLRDDRHSDLLQGRDVSDSDTLEHAARRGRQRVVRAAALSRPGSDRPIVRLCAARSAPSSASSATSAFRGLERTTASRRSTWRRSATRWPGRFLRAAGPGHEDLGAAGDADAGGARDHQEGRSATADHRHATLEEVVSLETAPRVVQLRVIGAFARSRFPARRHRHPRTARVHRRVRARARSASASRSAPRRATSCGW